MKTAMMSRSGGKEINGDCIGKRWNNELACFAAADGKGADAASKTAVETVLACFEARPELSAGMMREYLEAAKRSVTEERGSNKEAADAETTIVVLVTDGKKAVWGHCGDSRLYRIEKSLIQEVTEDQSEAFSSFMAGNIMYRQIRYSPERNTLLHCIGVGEGFEPVITGPVELPNKSSFLLCTDGFWEYVTEPDMEKTLKKADTPKKWIELMLGIWKRNAPADADNYSAIAVFA